MLKILIIGAVLGVLLFYSFRRLKQSFSVDSSRKLKSGFIQLDADSGDTNRAIRSTMMTVATGLILLVITLLLGMKIKILFILLPIACYLIGQVFLLANHLNALRKNHVWFNPETSTLWMEPIGEPAFTLNIYQDVKKVDLVIAVQQNRSVLFGYYNLHTKNGSIKLPSLLAENAGNNFFFNTLREGFEIKSTRSLFPLL